MAPDIKAPRRLFNPETKQFLVKVKGKDELERWHLELQNGKIDGFASKTEIAAAVVADGSVLAEKVSAPPEVREEVQNSRRLIEMVERIEKALETPNADIKALVKETNGLEQSVKQLEEKILAIHEGRQLTISEGDLNPLVRIFEEVSDAIESFRKEINAKITEQFKAIREGKLVMPEVPVPQPSIQPLPEVTQVQPLPANPRPDPEAVAEPRPQARPQPESEETRVAPTPRERFWRRPIVRKVAKGGFVSALGAGAVLVVVVFLPWHLLFSGIAVSPQIPVVQIEDDHPQLRQLVAGIQGLGKKSDTNTDRTVEAINSLSSRGVTQADTTRIEVLEKKIQELQRGTQSSSQEPAAQSNGGCPLAYVALLESGEVLYCGRPQ